ncbi:MAG TPA: hypothetical protein VFZ07_13360, partial [Dongiaceae bacterium]
EYTFTKCAMWPNVILDGTGTDIEEGGANPGLTLQIAVSGAHQGQFTFRHNNETDALSVAGTYDGKDIRTPRLQP